MIFSGFVYDFNLIEVLIVLICLRFLWARVFLRDLTEARGYPLFLFFLKRRSLINAKLLYGLKALQNSDKSELKSILQEEEQKMRLVEEYNILNRSSALSSVLVGIALAAPVLCINPKLMVSFFISDLLVARIHQHLSSSFDV